VAMRAAPISPADTYTATTGGALGPDIREPPYVAGHDGIGVVQKVYRPSIILLLQRRLPHLCLWRCSLAAKPSCASASTTASLEVFTWPLRIYKRFDDDDDAIYIW
jgi:hypothetical protein